MLPGPQKKSIKTLEWSHPHINKKSCRSDSTSQTITPSALLSSLHSSLAAENSAFGNALGLSLLARLGALEVVKDSSSRHGPPGPFPGQLRARPKVTCTPFPRPTHSPPVFTAQTSEACRHSGISNQKAGPRGSQTLHTEPWLWPFKVMSPWVLFFASPNRHWVRFHKTFKAEKILILHNFFLNNKDEGRLSPYFLLYIHMHLFFF